MLPYSRHLKPFARDLRRRLTDAELKLWKRLRRRQVQGVVFNRQNPLGSYIVDFFCASARLVIEVDGSQHMTPEGRAADAIRDAALGEVGLMVLRFDDRQVLLETDAVVEVIHGVVGERIGGGNPPRPPFFEGGSDCGEWEGED